MKKILLLTGLLTGIIGLTVVAQDPAKATWQLNANRAAIVAGNISAADQAAPATWSTPTYNKYTTDASNTVYPGLIDTAQRSLPTGGWPAAQQAEDANQWVEYKASPLSGITLAVDYIKFDFGDMGSTNVGKANIYYSLDGFQTRTQLNTSVLSLPKYSSTEIWLKSEYTPAITVPSGSTLSVRVYMYWPNTGSTNITNKSFVTKDVIISGTTTGTLPLTLLNFDAKKVFNQVNLNWSSTNEVNTDKFIVQRQNANGVFEEIGIVTAANIGGLNTYSFVDPSTAAGTRYYRLSQVDKDGSVTYSKVISVEVADVQLSVFPNPASGTMLTVSHPEVTNGKIEVRSVNGNVVLSRELVNGATSTNLDISKLMSGFYAVEFSNGKSIVTSKFIKQ